MSPGMAGDPVEELTQRLRGDLTAAIRNRDKPAVRVIRGLLTALANAEAVPLPDDNAMSVINPGEPVIGHRADVPRRRLTAGDVHEVVGGELARHDELIAVYDDLGQHSQVADLRAERDVLERYVP